MPAITTFSGLFLAKGKNDKQANNEPINRTMTQPGSRASRPRTNKRTNPWHDQQTNQSRQTISELEAKKIELIAQLHSKSDTKDNNDEENNEQKQKLMNLIKVISNNLLI